MLKYLKVYSKILLKDRSFRQSLYRNFFRILRILSYQIRRSSENKDIILISLTEHMGDVVAAEPIAAHLRMKYPDAHICWCVNQKYAEITRYNPAINTTLTVTCIAEWILLKKIFGSQLRVFDLHIDGRSCGTYKLTNKNTSKSGINIFNYLDHGNLLEVFAISGKVKALRPVTPVFHFSPDNNHDVVYNFEYIVIHTAANDNERNWHPAEWNRLVNYFLENYNDIHIVEVGLNPVVTNTSARYHDVTGKYSLQQIAHLIHRARLFTGVESGFAHFANALGTPSIVMIGHYQHYKNYQVYSGRFAELKDVVLHYHEGRLCDMSYLDIIPAVNKQMAVTGAGRIRV